MNILTIGDSPYLNTRNARINRDICLYLSSLGHKVDSIVYSHDTVYFIPGPRKESHYENIRLFPCNVNCGAESNFTYQTMKKSQPNVVISIGHYAQTDFLHYIKSIYPHLLKWVAIITAGSHIINEKHKDTLNYADSIIALNKSTFDGLNSILETAVKYIPYGAGEEFFDKGEEKEGILLSSKNSQISNISAYIVAMQGKKGTLHYNANDIGFYDIPLLASRYGSVDIEMPNNFVSVREGLTDISMNDLYNRHGIFIDCSMQSVTSISMLEAMKTGCIPIATNTGASKDILSKLPEEFRFMVESETYIGEKEEAFSIISHAGLRQSIEKVIKMSQNKEWLAKARNTVKCLSETFSKDNFLCGVNQIVQDTIAYEHTIVVDSLV